MESKIAYLSELEIVLCHNDKTDQWVFHFFSTFKVGRLLGSLSSFTSKGFDITQLLLSLLVFRLRGESICRMQVKSNSFFEKIDDNTFYRLMNNPQMTWRKYY